MTDARSDLERRFDAGPITEDDLIKLVKILKTERNAWLFNAKQTEKDKARLDWLGKQHVVLDNHGCIPCAKIESDFHLNPVRQAIDKAMKGATP